MFPNLSRTWRTWSSSTSPKWNPSTWNTSIQQVYKILKMNRIRSKVSQNSSTWALSMTLMSLMILSYLMIKWQRSRNFMENMSKFRREILRNLNIPTVGSQWVQNLVTLTEFLTPKMRWTIWYLKVLIKVKMRKIKMSLSMNWKNMMTSINKRFRL